MPWSKRHVHICLGLERRCTGAKRFGCLEAFGKKTAGCILILEETGQKRGGRSEALGQLRAGDRRRRGTKGIIIIGERWGGRSEPLEKVAL